MNEKRLRTTETSPPASSGSFDERTLFTSLLGDGPLATSSPVAASAPTGDDLGVISNPPPKLTLVFPEDHDEAAVEDSIAPTNRVVQSEAGDQPGEIELLPADDDESIEKFLLCTPQVREDRHCCDHYQPAATSGAEDYGHEEAALTAYEELHEHFTGDHSAVEEIALFNPFGESSLETAAAAVFADSPALGRITEECATPLEGSSGRVATPPAEDTVRSNEIDATPMIEPLLDEVSLIPLEAFTLAEQPAALDESAAITDVSVASNEEPAPAILEAESRPVAASLPGAHRMPPAIGSGKLVPARLTWKPGDPFAASAAVRRRFRWDLMLTTACITALCGLTAMWLLRAVLA